jgi:hypothetical protein
VYLSSLWTQSNDSFPLTPDRSHCFSFLTLSHPPLHTSFPDDTPPEPLALSIIVSTYSDTVTNCHLRCQIQGIILSVALFAADLPKYSFSDPPSPPRELTVRLSSSLLHTPLTSATGPGGGAWSADRNPAMLHKPLLRSPDRLDQHVSLSPVRAPPATQALLQDVLAVRSHRFLALASLGLFANRPRERRRSNNGCRYRHHGSRCWFRRNNPRPRAFEHRPGWYPTYSLVLDRCRRVVLCCRILRVRACSPLIHLRLYLPTYV